MKVVKSELYKGYKITVGEVANIVQLIGSEETVKDLVVYVNNQNITEQVVFSGSSADDCFEAAKSVIDQHITTSKEMR